MKNILGIFCKVLWSYFTKVSIGWKVVSIIVGITFAFIVKKGKHYEKTVVVGTLSFYICLMLASTVWTRPKMIEHRIELRLFWSVMQGMTSEPYLLGTVVYNVMMFIPIGIMLSLFDEFRFLRILLQSLVLSSLIEALQLVLQRGIFELDDIVFNITGAVIGYWICKTISKRFKKCSRK